MHRFSGLEGCYVAVLYCFRLDAGCDFGGPIEEKVSGLEGCHVAILYRLRLGRLGRLGNAWIFKFGRALCSNSLLFEPWEAAGCYTQQWCFRWLYRREGLMSGRLLCSNSLLFEAWKA